MITRNREAAEFSNRLLKIGEDKIEKDVNNSIVLTVGTRTSASIDLEEQVFNNIENSLNSLEYLKRRAIYALRIKIWMLLIWDYWMKFLKKQKNITQ